MRVQTLDPKVAIEGLNERIVGPFVRAGEVNTTLVGATDPRDPNSMPCSSRIPAFPHFSPNSFQHFGDILTTAGKSRFRTLRPVRKRKPIDEMRGEWGVSIR
jgi:hypothetical protein